MAHTPSANPQDKRQYFEQRLRQRQQELEQAVAEHGGASAFKQRR